MSGTSSLAEISIYCFVCRKRLDNLVLFLNMCLIHTHFLQENALQCNMEIIRFSPKTVSRYAVKWRYPYEHALP